MGIIKKMRRQRAVWWKRLSPDRYGRPSFAAPEEISCRWEDDAREFLSPQGEKLVSRSVVYVDRVMSVGDRLRLGELDSTIPNNPLSLNDTYEIRQFTRLPNLKVSEILYTAYL